MTERRRACISGLAFVMLALTTVGCTSDEAAPSAEENRKPKATNGSSRAPADAAPRAPASPCPRGAPFEPGSEEEQREIKREAGRVVQKATTYESGATPAELARSLALPGIRKADLARILGPLVEPGARSCGTIVYPQLSGLTADTAGVMVAVRQTTSKAEGAMRSRVRVLDVRMLRGRRGWTARRIASVGGDPVARPQSPSSEARRVLDHPAIELTDSARWDIQRGDVDDSLLASLARAADRRELSVLVFRSGHPPQVWATGRPSAHGAGRAVDIWGVGGEPVIDQRREGQARAVATEALAGGAFQVGSPWSLGARSFTDEVHQDHLHIQQR